MNTTTLSPVAGILENPRVDLAPMPSLPPAQETLEPHPALKPEADAALTNKSRRPSFKQAALALLALAACLGAARLGHDWWTVGRFMESTDDAYVGGDVTVIAPKVAGFIAQLAVGDNQTVQAGDLLVRLDDRDYRAALARADAAVALQQATLTNLDASRLMQEAVVAQTEAEIASADAEISRSQDDLARYRDLVAKSAVSVESFQQADTTYKQAVATGQKDRAARAAAERELTLIDTQKQQVRAALAEAVAERDLARLNLSYTELRAPVAGVVGNRSAQAGAYATVGAQLISLVPVRGLWIDANFKENQLKLIRPGEPVAVRVDGLPGRVFHGRVASLAPATGAEVSVLAPENATGNFTKIVQRVAVRIVLDDDPALRGNLRPGLSVTAEVDGRSTRKGAL